MSEIEIIKTAPSLFKISEREILSELLADKRSPNTRRAYERDLKDFFASVTNATTPTPAMVREFLELERFTAIALVLQYKAELIEKGLAEATVNRRLAAIKSLVRYAQKVGKCQWSLEEIEGEKVQTYRDTTGVDAHDFAKILAVPDRNTNRGKRDYAILNLLWSNVLRRGEICKLDIDDFNAQAKSLMILGKGRGTQKENIQLPPKTTMAIQAWLNVHPCLSDNAPLFVALNKAHNGHRLTGGALYNIVKNAARQAGTKHMSPHHCRHSGITAALDATNGDVRRVQKLSRHKNLNTVMIYDDSRKNQQSEISNLLSELV